mmetsp:Transcript_81406/g.228333  ORF Transcript_81406/g.228333 Transcript_81406/m.228333 type:complete len:146 (-) Transcript_81406:346-783(-)
MRSIKPGLIDHTGSIFSSSHASALTLPPHFVPHVLQKDPSAMSIVPHEQMRGSLPVAAPHLLQKDESLNTEVPQAHRFPSDPAGAPQRRQNRESGAKCCPQQLQLPASTFARVATQLGLVLLRARVRACCSWSPPSTVASSPSLG